MKPEWSDKLNPSAQCMGVKRVVMAVEDARLA
jgi:hypothetical protein